jgi:hypothetical protein
MLLLRLYNFRYKFLAFRGFDFGAGLFFVELTSVKEWLLIGALMGEILSLHTFLFFQEFGNDFIMVVFL